MHDVIADELGEHRGEQRTDIAWRQLPGMTFYRIDTELKQDIPLDDAGRIGVGAIGGGR
jgi:hypothetical protein